MEEFYIAIVDDDSAMLDTLSRLVRPHRVLAAERAHVILDLVREGREFDVIVSDLMMPEMTGADLYRGVVAINPAQGNRMLFLTGGATTSDAQEFVRKVPCPVVMKPFDRFALRGLIEKVGSEHRASAAMTR